MRNYLEKATIFVIILSLPSVILAANCAPNDPSCKQSQMQSAQSPEIKPLTPVTVSPVVVPNGKKDKSQQPAIVEVKPFEVPSPNAKSNKSTAAVVLPQTKTRKKSTFNIFAPETNTSSTNQSEENGDVANQESTPSTTEQQTGIQYR